MSFACCQNCIPLIIVGEIIVGRIKERQFIKFTLTYYEFLLVYNVVVFYSIVNKMKERETTWFYICLFTIP